MRAFIPRATFAALLFALLGPSAAGPGPTLKVSTTIGGASDQRGRLAVVADGALFVAGGADANWMPVNR